MAVPLPAVPGVAKVTFLGSFQGVAVNHVMHVRFGTDFMSITQANTLATGMRNAFSTNFSPLINGGVAYATVNAQDLTGDTGVTGTNATGITGTHGGTVLPANVAQCISWQHGRHYRGGHPRTYFTGLVSTDMLNPNTFSSAAVSAWQSAGSAFLAAVNAITGVGPGACTLSVVHYRKNGALLTSPLVDAITGCVVDSRIDTQRRRLGRDR
jgi:hypothetical protein